MQITERARRIGRAAVAARYNSEREKAKYIAGKYDDTANVIDATRAAQSAMNEMLPALTICEMALDQNDIALFRVTASDIRKATRKD